MASKLINDLFTESKHKIIEVVAKPEVEVDWASCFLAVAKMSALFRPHGPEATAATAWLISCPSKAVSLSPASTGS